MSCRTAALAAAILCAAPAAADDPWQGYGSLGVGMVPEYDGASSYEVLPYVEGRLNYDNYYMRFEGGALRFNILDDESFHAGPLVGFRRGRRDEDDPAVSLLRHFDDTVTAGGFVEWEHTADDPRSGESVTLSADDAVDNAFSGWTVVLRANARRPVEFVDPGLIASLELDMTWASRPYMQTYFGIAPAYAAASGLPAFSAGSGVESAGAAFSLDQFLSRHWSVGMRLHYGRVMGDAGDSPITRLTGSPDQLFAGVVVGYVL
jgi:MipA family protein